MVIAERLNESIATEDDSKIEISNILHDSKSNEFICYNTYIKRMPEINSLVLKLSYIPFLFTDQIVILLPSPTNVSLCVEGYLFCLLYTSPSPRDKRQSRMPSSA